ncbi:MAG: hypothetical protein ACSLFR_03950 [Solirubrobacteraceae bacterium]
MDRSFRPEVLLLAAVLAAGLIAIAFATSFGGTAQAEPVAGAAAKKGPWYSLQGSADPREAEAATQLGAKVARVEFEINTPVSKMRETMKMYDTRGIRVLLLAGFSFRVATGREVRNLATWAKTFGPGGELRKPIQHIEFGNETGFAHFRTQRRGFEYGKRCKQASLTLRAANRRVKILCQADDGNTGDGWIKDMYRAAPKLHRYVDGWVIHPYGDYWSSRLNDNIRELKRRGSPSSKKIDITEWGIATANGERLRHNYGLSRTLTYDQASKVLRTTTLQMRRKLGSRLRYVVLYRARDGAPVGATSDPEEYFGLVTDSGALKGALGRTASSLLRTSAAR